MFGTTPIDLHFIHNAVRCADDSQTTEEAQVVDAQIVENEEEAVQYSNPAKGLRQGRAHRGDICLGSQAFWNQTCTACHKRNI